jgi:hypothetical protein
MKRPPSDPGFVRFTEAIRQIMNVPKTEINRRIAAKVLFRNEVLAWD